MSEIHLKADLKDVLKRLSDKHKAKAVEAKCPTCLSTSHDIVKYCGDKWHDVPRVGEFPADVEHTNC